MDQNDNFDIEQQADELAALMKEFRLLEASLAGEDYKITFKKKLTQRVVAQAPELSIFEQNMSDHGGEEEPIPAPVAEKGTPVLSPMTGIFFTSSSPSAPAFIKEGDVVTAGQVIGLIEAMKVFNDVPSPLNGTVLKIKASNGQVVNLGDPLVVIG